MSTEAIHELNKYLDAINEMNEFDLAWRWAGHDTTPYVEVYEEAERHVLCVSTVETAVETVRSALPDWALEDPYES